MLLLVNNAVQKSRIQIKNKRTLVNLFKDIVLVTHVRIFCTALFTNNNIKIVTVDFIYIKLLYLHILLIFSNSSFIQYCDSNIGLFSTAPCKVITLNPFWYHVLCFFFDGSLSKVIALPTITIAIVVALKGNSEMITVTFR